VFRISLGKERTVDTSKNAKGMDADETTQ